MATWINVITRKVQQNVISVKGQRVQGGTKFILFSITLLGNLQSSGISL